MTFTLHHPFTFEYDGSQLMTGIIAGVYTTFARVAIDSYFGTAAGDESARGLKMVLPHVSAVLAGRGSVALFWTIVQDVSVITVPFDGLARLLPDLIGDTTHADRRNLLQLPPEYRASDLIFAGWSATLDQPVIHHYNWRYDEVGIEHQVVPGDGRPDRIIALPSMAGLRVPDVIKADRLLAIMRRQAAQAAAEAGHKVIGGDVIAATVFREMIQTKIIGFIDADGSEGESEPPAQARAGAAAPKQRKPRQKGKSKPQPKPPGRQ